MRPVFNVTHVDTTLSGHCNLSMYYQMLPSFKNYNITRSLKFCIVVVVYVFFSHSCSIQLTRFTVHLFISFTDSEGVIRDCSSCAYQGYKMSDPSNRSRPRCVISYKSTDSCTCQVTRSEHICQRGLCGAHRKVHTQQTRTNDSVLWYALC